MCDYFLEPFCSCCTGGPEPSDFSFRKLDTSMNMDTKQNQLVNPTRVDEIEHFIGKSLSTTRSKFLSVRFDEKRKEKKKKRLTTQDKLDCCQREHMTSICDLIYRMRVRSNYDNPEIPDLRRYATTYVRRVPGL